MAIPWRTILEDEVPQGSTCRLLATLTDETGAVVPGASLTTLTLTLYEKVLATPIGARNQQTILNANGGTVDSGGVLTLVLSPTDNAIQRVADGFAETHVALLEYSWAAGAKKNKGEVHFPVVNLVLAS